MRYYVGLGANIGRPCAQLAEAIAELTKLEGTKLLRMSSVYETAPVGVLQQPKFANMVVAVQVPMEPAELMDACLAIEKAMGRVRRERWGPRIIDLDLLLYDGPPVKSAKVTIPHPRLAERQFVLVPLAEIAPAVVLPDGREAAEAAKIGAPGIRRLGPIASCVRREQVQGWPMEGDRQ